MKPEDKQLLLADLCARLPYNVWVRYKTKYDDVERATILNGNYVREIIEGTSYWIDFKPYLRPMSSMTEEEHNEWFNYYHEIELKEAKSTGDYLKSAILGESASIDWLNKNMFDFRGLIPKDLALSTEIYNPYKTSYL